jgi:hypothetical protein
VIEFDTLPVYGGEPRAARWRKRVRDWLHRRGLCDRPYVVALAWHAEEGHGPSNGLQNAGVVYAVSPRDAAVKRCLMIAAWREPYVLVAVTSGDDDDTGTFFDEGLREIPMDEAVAVLAGTRV